MENYIVINGKKAELTKEQLEKLGIKIKVKNPCERVYVGEDYWYMSTGGEVFSDTETTGVFDEQRYNFGNYYNDEAFAKQRVLHQKLDNLLTRFTYENGWNEELWETYNTNKYYIYYNIKDKKHHVSNMWESKDTNVYFATREIAQRAIDEIIIPFEKENPQFVW